MRTGDVVHLTATPKDHAGRPIDGLYGPLARGRGRPRPAPRSSTRTARFVADEQGVYTVTAMVGTQSADLVLRVVAPGRRPRDRGRRPAAAPGAGAEVWVHPNGNCVYYSTIADRVYAIDVSNPAKPVIVDSMTTDARLINDVMTTEDGKYGVFSREGSSVRKNGIVVFDASNPCHPKPIADYTETVSGGVHSSFVYQGHVYLTDDATGSMRVISIEDPYHPREVGRWQTSQTDQGRYVHDIDIKDGIAYLSYLNDGLVILDVGNGHEGRHPGEAGADLAAQVRPRVSLSPGRAAVRARAARHPHRLAPRQLRVRRRRGLCRQAGERPRERQRPDVGPAPGGRRLRSSSSRGSSRGTSPPTAGVHNIWVEGDSLYVGNYQGGGRVVDISGDLKGDLLRQGREIAWLFTADSAGFKPRSTFTWGAVVKNGLIYYNDINTGLWITRLESKQRPVP